MKERMFEVVVKYTGADKILRSCRDTIDLETNRPEAIPDMIRILYDEEEDIHIESVKEFVWVTCSVCNGEQVIRACCRGDVRKIECACHGEDQRCDCHSGAEKKYINEHKGNES